mmetsp:Transcript_29354/g.113710  ORF Transcript_29354/g.113710 Transcript_29354/m.113710 type:complete len:144 (+) Transcript_29354:2273-2704(+)
MPTSFSDVQLVWLHELLIPSKLRRVRLGRSCKIARLPVPRCYMLATNRDYTKANEGTHEQGRRPQVLYRHGSRKSQAIDKSDFSKITIRNPPRLVPEGNRGPPSAIRLRWLPKRKFMLDPFERRAANSGHRGRRGTSSELQTI